MSFGGYVLGAPLRALAKELAAIYVERELVIVAGAGVSRASGLPGWPEMIASIQATAAASVSGVDAIGLERVLTALHSTDPIGRADTLRRIVRVQEFTRALHASLYGGLPAGEKYWSSTPHWHIASLVDHDFMPDVFTSNYDDLLEDAKKSLGRSGRIRHFHGRLPQAWSGTTRLGDPPVVTTRDYLAADEIGRYDKVAEALADKTVLLVGFSLADPNLARVIRSRARDCRALLIASPGSLNAREQSFRLQLLRRFWGGLGIAVTAIEAHEELPAFLLALRREVLELQGRRPALEGSRALEASAVANLWEWHGAREWRDALADAVVAAKSIVPELRRDPTLRAGFYGIKSDGYLTHAVSSDTTRTSHRTLPKRRLHAESPRPWGAAGYSYAAGVTAFAYTGGAGFDRNVPDSELVRWQRERATQGRLPPSSVVCVPAWVRYRRALVPVGVTYFSSRRSGLASTTEDEDELQSLLRLTFRAMITPGRAVEGGPV